MLVTVFQCIPVGSNWELPDVNKGFMGYCWFSSGQISLGSSIPYVFTDLVLLKFSVSHIWKLDTHRLQKIMLIFVFALGSLYVAVLFVSLLAPRKLRMKDVCSAYATKLGKTTRQSSRYLLYEKHAHPL